MNLVEDERVFRESPTALVYCGKMKKSLPKAISEADVAALIDTAAEHGFKNQMVLELLYGLGGCGQLDCHHRGKEHQFNIRIE
ncbi:hypothetical protein [Paenibacillus silvae]|uniref:hypothetical protein n=1 Tax=Paenibacillus silvae TaxID=1325358 RepID=UPI0011A90B61|nr:MULTISPECIES: hypothetical protein [Paenibacillus]MCK6076941.1 hypothetical protein [Paenibacillus silvae]MCK6152701.1 hypothetical protein [Paenibacillus silvae]MCK6269552.1 hypothetical protein [Paenibacillus silvae]